MVDCNSSGASEGVMNILLEVPTGLRFTEVDIRGRGYCLLSAVTLTEACCKTLVKLSYTVSFFCRFHPFSWSTDSSTRGTDADTTPLSWRR